MQRSHYREETVGDGATNTNCKSQIIKKKAKTSVPHSQVGQDPVKPALYGIDKVRVTGETIFSPYEQ